MVEQTAGQKHHQLLWKTLVFLQFAGTLAKTITKTLEERFQLASLKQSFGIKLSGI